MRGIHIANAKRRDAEVAFDAQYLRRNLSSVTQEGNEKINLRIIKSTIQMDQTLSLADADALRRFADKLIQSDPEIDMETTGKILRRTHRLWVSDEGQIAYRVNLYRIVMNPDGSERERRDVNKLPGNINKVYPLRWSGRYFPKREGARQFVFTRSYQIRHINGATFDFLYNMAKDLHDRSSLVLVGGGERGSDPVILSRGGQPYRAFLEGRIDGDRYLLILHLTDIELKALPEVDDPDTSGKGDEKTSSKRSIR